MKSVYKNVFLIHRRNKNVNKIIPVFFLNSENYF